MRTSYCVVLSCLLWAHSVCAKEPAPVTVALSAKDFQLPGDWHRQMDQSRAILFSSTRAPTYPAVAAIVIPRAGTYRLWVSAKDFPNYRPGTRTLAVSIAGQKIAKRFGKSGQEHYEFEDGGAVQLAAGPTLVTLDNATAFARFHGLILTTDARLAPKRPITPGAYPAAKLHPLATEPEAARPDAELVIESDKPQASLANEHVQLDFLRARRGPQSTLAMAVRLKTKPGWQTIAIDPTAEGYFVNQTPATAELQFEGFYPRWTKTTPRPMTIEMGGARVSTISGVVTHSQMEVGTRTRLIPQSATLVGNEVRVAFYPADAGRASAVWRLPAGQPYADVELAFTPAAAGQFALSYELFFRRDLDNVAELLLPLMYHRQRLPEFDVTLLSNTTPTPLSLVQAKGPSPTVLAVVADPRDIPFQWPDGRCAAYALSIRGPQATVQPSISGPVIGTAAAARDAGKLVRLRYKVLVQSGDWYAGFRTAVDAIFGLRDYRQSVRTSLSDAVQNMIDLYLDDDHGGWWERAKAPYQIESKNGSTHAAPMLPLSLYRLTGDQRLLERRALPTLAFMLSRDGAHFSPVPEDGGLYPSGSMNGPVKLFGTTTYAGLWELTGRRTPACWEIAQGTDAPRTTAGYSHGSAFGDYLARYQLTGHNGDLAKACALADAYIERYIATPPRKDLGTQPFFFISFVPDWEGLLYLYEATHKQAYLDAAVFGARQLMTGLWTQPVIPPGNITVHSDGQYADLSRHDWWKGPKTFRLGTPRKPNDTPAREVPAWTVSNVGLGFEQPCTYRSSATGRQIWQMGFSAHFLRLYRYTHDQAFLTCARNAVVGRWGNYPGYYVTGLTDLPHDPAYPLHGPDVTDFYYHHIEPHLAWSIDYLVSEAEMLSDGAIAFPALRQYGYAYFDSRIFGHAAGKIFGEPAWLLFRRGVVAGDNPQINTLLAWNEGRLYVVLTNQSQREEQLTLTAGDQLAIDPAAGLRAMLRIGAGQPKELPASANGRTMRLTIPARGLATVTLTGVRVAPPARPQPAADRRSASALVTVSGAAASTRAAALQFDAGRWYAYVWSTATPQQARSARLHCQESGRRQTLEKNEYPFEFLVLVSDERETVRFQLELIQPDGKTTTGPETSLRLP